MHVLLVCLGNICRSPTAEGIVRHKLSQAGLADRVEVDSCGTGGWHVGQPPDSRAQEAAARRGFDLSALRARQLTEEDFERFDYILAMDQNNLQILNQRRPGACRARIGLLLDYAGYQDRPVPDPYYGGEWGFEEVLDLVEAGAEGLVEDIRRRLEARS